MKTTLFAMLACMAFIPQFLNAQSSQAPNESFSKKARENALLEAKISSAFYRNKYNGDDAMQRKLFELIHAQKLELLETTEKYAKTLEMEVRMLQLMAKNDSVLNAYLAAAQSKNLINGTVLPANDNSKFAVAARMKNFLKLNKSQVDSLLYHTRILHQLWAEKPGFSPKDYERKFLPSILNDSQYTLVLAEANRKKSLDAAKTSWEELKQRNLAAGLDSVRCVTQIYSYNLAKAISSDRFGNTMPKLSAGAPAEEPDALKKLKAAKKYNNPVPDKNSAAGFAW